jgi:hypothetical protein
MPKQITRFNWGTEIKNINDTLYNQLNDSFTSTANVLNTKPTTYVTNVDPLPDSDVNKQFVSGDMWVNSSTDTAWILTSRTTNTAATWKQIT